MFEIQDAAGLNLVTKNLYDGLDRLTSSTMPEGNKTSYAYDTGTNPWAMKAGEISFSMNGASSKTFLLSQQIEISQV